MILTDMWLAEEFKDDNVAIIFKLTDDAGKLYHYHLPFSSIPDLMMVIVDCIGTTALYPEVLEAALEGK